MNKGTAQKQQQQARQQEMLQASSFRSANMDSSSTLTAELNLFSSFRTDGQRSKVPLAEQQDTGKKDDKAPEIRQYSSSQSMQEMLFAAKSLFRAGMLQKYTYIKEICKVADTTTEEYTKGDKYKQAMQDISKSDLLLYPPNTQAMEKARTNKASEGFVMFQELLHTQMEHAFTASGLVKKCMETERQNAFLFQLLTDAELPSSAAGKPISSRVQPSSRPASRRSEAGAFADDESNQGSEQVVEQPSYFDKHYELLKIEILKRLKKDLHLETVARRPGGERDDDQRFRELKDKLNHWPQKSESDCTPDQLIKDEDLFKTIREEVVGALEQQRNDLKQQYDRKVEKIQNINYELRKSCLRELQLLREAYFLQNANKIDAQTALKYTHVHLFQYDEGLDEQICDLLNTKIKQVSSEFVAHAAEQQQTIDNAHALIGKYKALAPRTFRLAELSLTEIFTALAAIHRNSFEIFNTLLACFPQDYFVGVIEDTFGAFFDNDSEAKLNRQLDRIQREMQEDVAAMAEQFQKEKALFKSQTAAKDQYVLEIKRAHAQAMDELAEATDGKIQAAVDAERARQQGEHRRAQRLLEEKCQRNKDKYEAMKSLHLEDESRLCFFKWKVLTQALTQHSPTDVKDLMKTLTRGDRQKMQNSLEARDSKNKTLRTLLESTSRQLFELQEKYNEVYADNLDLQNKYDVLKSTHSALFHRTHSLLLPRTSELETEKKVLQDQLNGSLKLVEKAHASQVLLEEKYNVRSKKVNVDPKDRVVLRLFNEFGIQAEATKMLIHKQMQQAIETDPGVFKPILPTERGRRRFGVSSGASSPTRSPPRLDMSKTCTSTRDVECQTDIQNLSLTLEFTSRADRMEKPTHTLPKGQARECESQTHVDWELWDELLEAHHVYRELLQHDDISDLRRLILEEAAALPTKIGRTRASLLDAAPGGSQSMGSKQPGQRGSGAARTRTKSRSRVSKQVLLSTSSAQQSAGGSKQMSRPGSKQKHTKRLDDELSEESDPDSTEGPAPLNSKLQPGLKVNEAVNASKGSSQEERQLQQMLHAYNEEAQKMEEFELELQSLEPEERFDRLRFLFETNLDLVEIFKQREPQLYRDALAFLKHKAVSDNEKMLRDEANPAKQSWRAALLENSSNQLKRLYPRNQPEVFNRLKKPLDDKEFQRAKMLQEANNLRWEQKFNMTTGASSDFTNLLSQVHRAKPAKDKRTLRNAQQELLRYIDKQQMERTLSAGKLRPVLSVKHFAERVAAGSRSRGRSSSIYRADSTRNHDDTLQMQNASIPESRRDDQLMSARAPRKDTFKPHILHINSQVELPNEAHQRLLRGSYCQPQRESPPKQGQIGAIRLQVFALPNQQPTSTTATAVSKLKQKQDTRGSFNANDLFNMTQQLPRSGRSPISPGEVNIDQKMNLDLTLPTKLVDHSSGLLNAEGHAYTLAKQTMTPSGRQSPERGATGLPSHANQTMSGDPQMIADECLLESPEQRLLQSFNAGYPQHSAGAMMGPYSRNASPNADTAGDHSNRMNFQAMYHPDASQEYEGSGTRRPTETREEQGNWINLMGTPHDEFGDLRAFSQTHIVAQNNQAVAASGGSSKRQFKNVRPKEGVSAQANSRRYQQHQKRKGANVESVGVHSTKQELQTTSIPGERAVLQSLQGAPDEAVKMIDQLASSQYAEKPQTAMAAAGQAASNLAMVQQNFGEVAMFKTEPEKRPQEEKYPGPTGEEIGDVDDSYSLQKKSLEERSQHQREVVLSKSKLSPKSPRSSMQEVHPPSAMAQLPDENQTQQATQRGLFYHQDKKSSTVTSSQPQLTEKRPRYAPQYHLQNMNKSYNPNAGVKITCRRVRPQTGKQNGRGRTLVRTRGKQIPNKKSQASVLMKDFMKQDRKLHDLNNHSSQSMVGPKNLGGTQPLHPGRYLRPSNGPGSLTFDMSTPDARRSELSRSDPISAFNRNNKKVSAYMRNTVQAATPRTRMHGSQTSQSFPFGVPLRNPSAFDAVREPNQHSNHFIDNPNTQSLLIVDHALDQKHADEASGRPNSPQTNIPPSSPTSPQNAIIDIQQNLVAPTLDPTLDQRSRQDDELDWHSRVHVSYTNAVNSPGASSSGRFTAYKSIFKNRGRGDPAQQSTRLQGYNRDLQLDKVHSQNSTTLSNHIDTAQFNSLSKHDIAVGAYVTSGPITNSNTASVANRPDPRTTTLQYHQSLNPSALLKRPKQDKPILGDKARLRMSAGPQSVTNRLMSAKIQMNKF